MNGHKLITVEQLAAWEACAEGIELFKTLFPEGATLFDIDEYVYNDRTKAMPTGYGNGAPNQTTL